MLNQLCSTRCPDDVESIGINLVLFVARRRQDDDRRQLQLTVASQLTQKFKAVHPRHIEVQQHETTLTRHSAVFQHGERFATVGGHVQGIENLVLLECASHVHHVDLVIFNKENVQHLVIRHSPGPLL